MSFLSSIEKVGVQALMATATGGESLALQAASRLFSSLGQQVLQNVGTKLGLPQGDIDMAKATFAASYGDEQGAATNLDSAVNDFVSAAGGGYSDQNEVSQIAQMVSQELEQQATTAAQGDQNQGQAATAAGGGTASGAAAGADASTGLGGTVDASGNIGGSGGGTDFLTALAEALGKALDDDMGQMVKLGQQIDAQTQQANSSGGQQQPVISQLSAQLQALGQKIQILSNALDNSLKSIGESASTLAKKD